MRVTTSRKHHDASKHGAELTVRARAMWLRALGIVNERGKSPAQHLADQFEANPLSFMEKLSRYLPKDLNINQTTTVQMVDLLNLFWSAREGRVTGANLVHSNQMTPVVQRISDNQQEDAHLTN